MFNYILHEVYIWHWDEEHSPTSNNVVFREIVGDMNKKKRIYELGSWATGFWPHCLVNDVCIFSSFRWLGSCFNIHSLWFFIFFYGVGTELAISTMLPRFRIWLKHYLGLPNVNFFCKLSLYTSSNTPCTYSIYFCLYKKKYDPAGMQSSWGGWGRVGDHHKPQ